MRSTPLAAITVVLLTGSLLAGCVNEPVPMPTPTPTSTTGSPAPEVQPEINLAGTAGQNKAYFDLVNQQLIAAGGALDGRAFIDNLVAVGYPKADMEVTPDRTAINGEASSVQFSIRLSGTCLIGQYGAEVGYASTTAPLLGTGKCLIGTTRPIDW